jgi:hypothetical protein
MALDKIEIQARLHKLDFKVLQNLFLWLASEPGQSIHLQNSKGHSYRFSVHAGRVHVRYWEPRPQLKSANEKKEKGRERTGSLGPIAELQRMIAIGFAEDISRGVIGDPAVIKVFKLVMELYQPRPEARYMVEEPLFDHCVGTAYPICINGLPPRPDRLPPPNS